MLNAVLVSDPDFASQIIQVFHGNFNLSAYVLNSKANAFRLETEKKPLGTAGRCPRLFGGVPHTSKLQMLGLAVGCGSLSPMKQEKWGSIVILHDLAMSKSPRS